MTVFIAIGLPVAIVALVGVMVWVFRSVSEGAAQHPRTSTPSPRPVPVHFHVAGGKRQRSDFSVPLGAGDVDDVLRDLLLHESIEVYRGNARPRSSARRGDPSRGLRTPRRRLRRRRLGRSAGRRPAPRARGGGDLAPPHALAGYDPLAHLGEQEFDIEPSVATPDEESELGPISADIKLTRSTDRLRAEGVNPDDMGLEDLDAGPAPHVRLPVERRANRLPDRRWFQGRHLHRRPGRRSDPARHPSASPRGVSGGVGVGHQPVRRERDRGGSPAGVSVSRQVRSVRDVREGARRDARVRFVTRERIQTFVDGFALQ